MTKPAIEPNARTRALRPSLPNRIGMNTKTSPVWHPFTQHAVFPSFRKIESAEGAYLYTAEGDRIIDAIASWWVVTHGHCHPRIRQAVERQIAKLDQIIFAGYTHEPAERAAELLVDLTPDGLDYVFFSDSGSTCVEVALKMALGYWYHQNIAKHRVLVLEHGYHGDTIGTMSVGERGVFNQPYNPLLFTVEKLPFPHAGRESETLAALEACASSGDVAALIVEPLVLGAGGMLMYSAEVLSEMKRICEHHGVLLIADEVMTGWGRTGTLFACDQAGVVPDIGCYSKGITGGFLPLAATLCSAPIFDAHYSQDRSKTFFHSSSYTANPIACAAAAANLEMWCEDAAFQRLREVCDMQSKRLEQLAGIDRLANVRRCGSIVAMDVMADDAGYLSDIGTRLYIDLQESGVLLRPLGNTLYVLPPYCVTCQDLDQIYETIIEAVRRQAA